MEPQGITDEERLERICAKLMDKVIELMGETMSPCRLDELGVVKALTNLDEMGETMSPCRLDEPLPGA